MALHLNNDQDRRGALNDLTALAWKWEERARAAERTLRRRRVDRITGLASIFVIGFVSGAVAVLACLP
jgi:hypothetical protein